MGCPGMAVGCADSEAGGFALEDCLLAWRSLRPGVSSKGPSRGDTARTMSQEPTAEALSHRRPARDQILVRLPFLVDLVAAAALRLPPGSPLRRRGVKWGFSTAWDGLSRGDFEPARLIYEGDAEVFLFGVEGLGLAERYTGERGWHEFARDIFENFGEPRFTTQRVRDCGDLIVAEIALAASGKVSGVPVVRSVSNVYSFSPRGKIARQDVFWQHDSWSLALAAAGLAE